MATELELELQERLGHGSIADVWKAFVSQSQSYVAVKVFYPDLLENPDFLTFYQGLPRLHEAKQIVSLQHPNIVRMYGFDFTPPEEESEEAQAYIVMDYIEGPTLAHYLRNTSYKREFPSTTEVRNLFASIAAAIDYAHQQGVIHGDLKPTNILLDKHSTERNPMGEPMITDFGMNLLLEKSAGALTHEKFGAPFYISPEQARGNPATERSDIYALGVMLYETCVGTRPFQGDTPAVIREQHINTMPPEPREVNPNISPAVSAIIMRCLAKDPQERFPSTASMTTAMSEAFATSALEPSGQSATESASSMTDTMNGHANPGSTESPPAHELEPPLVSPFPHVATQSPPQSLTSASNGQGVSATPPDTIWERPAEDQTTPIAFSTPEPEPAFQPTSSNATTPVAPLPPPIRPEAPAKFLVDRKPGKRFSKKVLIALIALLVILLTAATLVALLTFLPKNTRPASQAVTNPLVGRVYFLSSGQLYVNNNQGIYDEVLIDLHNLAPLNSGKSYYAWLLSDSNQSDVSWVSLGKLSVNQGKVHFLYPGQQTHMNLLINYSRMLITEENTDAPSINPVANPATWRYFGQIYQLPSPKDLSHFSLLDHLRHLLVQAPELAVLGFPGGLSIWLMRNIEELLRWSVEAKDRFLNTQALRVLLTDILYYLDGECAQADLQGTPSGAPLKLTNPTLAHIASFALINPCLQEQQQQANALKQVFRNTPHDFVDHLLFHLNGVVQSPGTLTDINALILRISTAISKVKTSLEHLRQDALQLAHMTDKQLAEPSAQAIVGDMALQARYAYAGQVDPVTGMNQDGALWVYNNVQRLATFAVMPYSSK